MFVSSQTYTGNLGGVDGADALCQALADAGTPAISGRLFKAWISDQNDVNVNPLTRFDRTTDCAEYVTLSDGALIASSFDDLIDGNLQIPINIDETPQFISGNFNVWTNTNADGTRVNNDRGCEDWGSNGGGSIGQVGDASATNSAWTLKPGGSGVGQLACDQEARLYCFQQDSTGTLFLGMCFFNTYCL